MLQVLLLLLMQQLPVVAPRRRQQYQGQLNLHKTLLKMRVTI
jgi:hypothetical protein